MMGIGLFDFRKILNGWFRTGPTATGYTTFDLDINRKWKPVTHVGRRWSKSGRKYCNCQWPAKGSWVD